MGTYADVSSLPKVVSGDDFQNKNEDDSADYRHSGELPPCGNTRADSGPGETGSGTQVNPQVRIGVNVVGTSVSVGPGIRNDLVMSARALNCKEDVVSVEVWSADRAAAWMGTRNSNNVRPEDRTDSGFRSRAVAGIDDGVKAGATHKGADKVLDRPDSRLLPCVHPWSIQPRSKDRKHRSSHRLQYMVPCMNCYGMCIIDNFLGGKIGDRILCEVQELHHAGRMQDGKLSGRVLDNTKRIRGDQIVWVEGNEQGCENIGYLLSRMDKLIISADGKLGKHKIRGRHSKCRSERFQDPT
ncbi:Egl nine -like protein 1 [Channa argus]|uniref:Egl nine-like protein 1 n=1 Tax=Channa argus TaxID=215402 RepID=A0A6G1QDU9_CHAAH|nr:Egl nine -like protein 1 [Channa argus]